MPYLDIKVLENESIADLIVCSDLVISGYSSVAIESLYFNVCSIRAGNFSEFPLFDFEKEIPTFYDSKTFQDWFNEKQLSKDFSSNKLDKTFEHYFSSNKKNADELFWDFIDKNIY